MLTRMTFKSVKCHAYRQNYVAEKDSTDAGRKLIVDNFINGSLKHSGHTITSDAKGLPNTILYSNEELGENHIEYCTMSIEPRDIDMAESYEKSAESSINTKFIVNGEGEKGEIRECLNKFIPPREFLRDKIPYTQFASSEPASVSEIIRLGEKCQQLLTDTGAKENGICDLRWAINQELFGLVLDELIRQEVIKCTESGRLLVKVRDECHLTVDYLKKLYASAAAYSIRKVLEADEKKKALIEIKERLEEEVRVLGVGYVDLLEKYDSSQVVYEDLKRELELKHLREIEYLAQINEEVKEQLRTIVPARKAEEGKKV